MIPRHLIPIDIWYVGVLWDKQKTFYVEHTINPTIWEDFYVPVGEDFAVAQLVAIEAFEKKADAIAYADKLKASTEMIEWVAQSNPEFDDLKTTWHLRLQLSSMLYCAAYIRNLEKLADVLNISINLINDLEKQRLRHGIDRWDDPEADEGGSPSPLSPIPPSLSPGDQREYPT